MATGSFSKRLDRVEAALAPKLKQIVLFFTDMSHAEIDAHIRDVVKPHPSQEVIVFSIIYEKPSAWAISP